MGCGASSSLDYDPTGPISLASFRVERVLGEGGFGKVKYVVKKDSNAGFAMKCMDKHRVIEKKHQKMVHKERALLIDLTTVAEGGKPCHFITNLHFAFHDSHTLYLVMDLALGGTLKYHLKKSHPKGFPEAQARFYAAQIASGLQYLHSKLILYRDCKPENM